MRITNLEADAIELQKRLVGPEPVESKCGVHGILKRRLFEAGVADLVEKSVNVEISDFKKSIRVPYAYQNGRLNLISPVQFDSDAETILTKTGKSAIEGQLLYSERHSTRGEMRLVVVANFDEQIEASTRDFVKKTFDEHDVTLYSFEDLGPLVEDIKRSAAFVFFTSNALPFRRAGAALFHLHHGLQKYRACTSAKRPVLASGTRHPLQPHPAKTFSTSFAD
jgi:hypothetical protein